MLRVQFWVKNEVSSPAVSAAGSAGLSASNWPLKALLGVMPRAQPCAASSFGSAGVSSAVSATTSFTGRISSSTGAVLGSGVGATVAA